MKPTFVFGSPTAGTPTGGVFTHLTRIVDRSCVGAVTVVPEVAAPVAISDKSATAVATRTLVGRLPDPPLSVYAPPREVNGSRLESLE